MGGKINTIIKKETTFMEENIRKTAIDCLLAICEDPEARSSDRVAAAKLLLELDRPEEGGNTITVIMEGVAKEYCN